MYFDESPSPLFLFLPVDVDEQREDLTWLVGSCQLRLLAILEQLRGLDEVPDKLGLSHYWLWHLLLNLWLLLHGRLVWWRPIRIVDGLSASTSSSLAGRLELVLLDDVSWKVVEESCFDIFLH